MESTLSGVGVLDKSLRIVGVLRDEPMSLQRLVEVTGFSRATVHRLAVALETHGMLRRTQSGRFALGLDLIALGRTAGEQFPITEAAAAPMARLRERTGESVQLYVPDGESRVCIAALESPHGLRTIVDVGAVLPIEFGSGGRALSMGSGRPGVGTPQWTESVGERESGVASVSAPVWDANGSVPIAAVSISGPADRMGPHPGERHGGAVVEAARAIEDALGHDVQ